jgi:RNA polymerase sigma factor (sigma-70 family)
MGLEAETVIVTAAQGGSEPAWRQLFVWHFDAVYRFCLVLAAGRRELAEETAQQAFVTAARQIGRFDPRRGEFRAWLLGIARNRFLALQAKERRRRRYETRSQQDSPRPAGGHEPDLHVHEALARLPADYRRALEGKYLKQLTMKEMAQVRGLSIEAIESLLRRARDKFAQVYAQVRDSPQEACHAPLGVRRVEPKRPKENAKAEKSM